MSRHYDAEINRTSWRLYFVQIKLVARQAFDLTQLGKGWPERLCSALILGAIFFFAALLITRAAKMQTDYSICIAMLALVTVKFTSVLLIVGKADSDLKIEEKKLKNDLVTLKEESDDCDEEDDQYGESQPSRHIDISQREKRCPYCREWIQKRAVKCRHCLEYLDDDFREQLQPGQRRNWNPGVAAVLSFLIPGLGQIYKGQILNGFAWLLVVLLGYCCAFVPGFFLHIICIFGAASGSE